MSGLRNHDARKGQEKGKADSRHQEPKEPYLQIIDFKGKIGRDGRIRTFDLLVPNQGPTTNGTHEQLSLKRRSISCSRKLLTNVLAARGGIARVWFRGHGNRERRERPGRRGVDPYTVALNRAHFSAAPSAARCNPRF